MPGDDLGATGHHHAVDIGLHEAGVAVRQVHREEVDLTFHPADHRKRLTKVSLRVPGVMP